MIIRRNSEMITNFKQRIFELFYLTVFRKILNYISCCHLQLVIFFFNYPSCLIQLQIVLLLVSHMVLIYKLYEAIHVSFRRLEQSVA